MRSARRQAAWRIGAALAVLFAIANPAPAFYWSIRSFPTLPTPGNPGNPPGSEPTPLPPDNPGGNPEPGGPGSVPEPTTAAAGITGLILLGARRLARRIRA
jgi:hypothetical protein